MSSWIIEHPIIAMLDEEHCVWEPLIDQFFPLAKKKRKKETRRLCGDLRKRGEAKVEKRRTEKKIKKRGRERKTFGLNLASTDNL